MDDVLWAFRRLPDIIAEIAAASNYQRRGMPQANETVLVMDEATGHNAA